ncbi:MAG: VOC family protein, partial [Dehalococcoidia bacterium]|nr:VOC family protein [Dehalococcoidia bacterium]
MSTNTAIIDHVVINVRSEMDKAVEVFRSLGFTMTPRGFHSLGSINHLAMFDNNYLELLGV